MRPDFVVARLNRAIARLPIVYRSEAEVDERRRDYARELEAACHNNGVAPRETNGPCRAVSDMSNPRPSGSGWRVSVVGAVSARALHNGAAMMP